MDFIQQQFQAASNNKSLIGSTFSEAYNQKLPRNVMLTESLTITPTWNIVNALSATGSLAVTMPLFKRLHLTLGALDNFLNDPSPGFKKNSFQFTTGITYVIP